MQCEHIIDTVSLILFYALPISFQRSYKSPTRPQLLIQLSNRSIVPDHQRVVFPSFAAHPFLCCHQFAACGEWKRAFIASASTSSLVIPIPLRLFSDAITLPSVTSHHHDSTCCCNSIGVAKSCSRCADDKNAIAQPSHHHSSTSSIHLSPSNPILVAHDEPIQ